MDLCGVVQTGRAAGCGRRVVYGSRIRGGLVCLPAGHENADRLVQGWADVGKVRLSVVSRWLGHANVQVTSLIFGPAVVSDYGVENVGWRLQSSEKDAGGVLWFVTDRRTLERQ